LIDEALAWYAWDFARSDLAVVRRGVVLLLCYFFAFIPAVIVFAMLSHISSPLTPLAWLIPPIVPAVSITFLTRPWPAMTRRERRASSRLRHWTLWLVGTLSARCAYDCSFRVGNFVPFDHVVYSLDGVIAIAAVLWVRQLCHLLSSLALRLDCPTLAMSCQAGWFFFAIACMACSLPDVLYWQWDLSRSQWSPADQLLRIISDTGGILMPMAVGAFYSLLVLFWIYLNLAMRGIDHHFKLRIPALRSA
jgi:hypothetical protein